MKQIIILLSASIILFKLILCKSDFSLQLHDKNEQLDDNIRYLSTANTTSSINLGLDSLQNTNLTVASNYVNYNNYTLFNNDCNAKVPVKASDCTNMKYPEYWCCQVDYIVSTDASYCTAYSDIDAKSKVSIRSLYYSYTCSSKMIKIVYSLVL